MSDFHPVSIPLHNAQKHMKNTLHAGLALKDTFHLVFSMILAWSKTKIKNKRRTTTTTKSGSLLVQTSRAGFD